MKILKVILPIIALVMLSTGCRHSNASELAIANKYDKDKEIIEYSLNTAIYQKAIEDILCNDGGDIEEIKRIATEYQDILSDEFVEVLFSNGVVYEDTPLIDEDDFNMTEEQLALDDTEINLEESIDNSTENIEDGDFGPNIMEEDPVFSVTGMDAYSDRLIASVAYKYGNPLKVWVGLDEGKITGYKIYR